ncbi:hypothetical protein KY284_000760 [Solanum tuberosum]|nr:hypothetical protein KY284_000760 [Solanum tuberosum]
MSSVNFEYCIDDISQYTCRNMSYEQGENEFCEVYDGPYEHGNGDLVYDDDSYEGYDGPWDNEQHGGVEGPYGVCHCDNEGSHALHHGYDGDMSSNVSCSSYDDDVRGREGGTLSYELVELRESLTTLREDFDDFLRMFEKVKSMVQKRQVIHHEDKPKDLPLEAKQDTPYKDGTKELNMKVKTSTPSAPKCILVRKPSEAPQNVKNHEVLESFQKEQMCSNVDNQGEDTSSYKLQGNNSNSYTSLNLEHHCVASSPLSVNDNLSICDHSESLPSDVLDSTLLYDDNILVVNEKTLVDPIDD